MNLQHVTAFEAKWGSNPIACHGLLMMLEASEAILKTKFPEKNITMTMIIEFSKVVIVQATNSDLPV